jgi:hypothetical protein
MGANDGGLTRALQADLSAGRAIELYLETPPFEFPENTYLIGAGWTSALVPEVCLWPWDEEERIEWIASTFKDLVLQRAFAGFETDQFNFQFRFGLFDEQRLKEVREWATAAYSFEAYEFSDDKNYCARIENMTLAGALRYLSSICISCICNWDIASYKACSYQA